MQGFPLTIALAVIVSLMAPTVMAEGADPASPEEANDAAERAAALLALLPPITGATPKVPLPVAPGGGDGGDDAGDDGDDGDGGMHPDDEEDLLCLPAPTPDEICTPDDDDAPAPPPAPDAPNAPEAPEEPTLPAAPPAPETPDTADVAVPVPNKAGLVGRLGALLSPVGAVARDASVAASALLTDVVASGQAVLAQATRYTESRGADALLLVQSLVAKLDGLVSTLLAPPSGGSAGSGGPAFTPQAAMEAPAATAVRGGAYILAAASGVGLLLVAFAGLRRLLTVGGLTLLSRIPSKDILKSETRQGIFDIVQNDPGVSLNEIVGRLGFSRNAIAYHLAVFESEKTVVSVKDGKYRRYFVNGGKYVNGAKDVVSTIKNDVTLHVIRYILAHPGTMQKDVCSAVGTSPSATNWHITRLEKVGLVAKQKVANTVRYTPGPSLAKYDLGAFGLGSASALAAPPAPVAVAAS